MTNSADLGTFAWGKYDQEILFHVAFMSRGSLLKQWRTNNEKKKQRDKTR